jgi:hypothetical protein
MLTHLLSALILLYALCRLSLTAYRYKFWNRAQASVTKAGDDGFGDDRGRRISVAFSDGAARFDVDIKSLLPSMGKPNVGDAVSILYDPKHPDQVLVDSVYSNIVSNLLIAGFASYWMLKT